MSHTSSPLLLRRWTDRGDLVKAVDDHVLSLNWGYRRALSTEGVTYRNAKARFADANDPHALEIHSTRKNVKVCARRSIIIACGADAVVNDLF